MRSAAVAAALAVLGCTSLASAQEATEPTGEPAPAASAERDAAPKGVPEGPALTTGRRDYTLVGFVGLATFGVGWATTIVLGATTASGDKKLAAAHAAVPVGGPFIMLAEGSHADGIEPMLAILGVVQGAGVAATFLGFTLESKTVGDTAVSVQPVLGPGYVGVSGAF